MKKSKSVIYFVSVLLAIFIIVVGARAFSGFIGEFTSDARRKLALKEDTQAVELLVLVNRKNSFENRNSGLVSVYENKTGSYYVKDKTVLVDERIIKPLNKMMDDFYKHSGLKTVNVISGYRSVEYQKELYEKIKAQNGADYAKRYCAKPKYSEHHTGLAIDLGIYHSDNGSSENFNGKGEYSWFYDNCYRYGFILRYDENKEDITGIAFEPWHFRYVGVKAATNMHKDKLCLEEYLAEQTH